MVACFIINMGKTCRIDFEYEYGRYYKVCWNRHIPTPWHFAKDKYFDNPNSCHLLINRKISNKELWKFGLFVGFYCCQALKFHSYIYFSLCAVCFDAYKHYQFWWCLFSFINVVRIAAYFQEILFCFV